MKACCITKHLRVIPNVWHFQFKVGFRVYGGMVRFRGGVAHTLMRRYMPEYPTFSRHFTKLDLGSN